MAMDVEPLPGPLGADVMGIDLSDFAGDETLGQIKAALLDELFTH